jgi:putative membrane protein
MRNLTVALASVAVLAAGAASAQSPTSGSKVGRDAGDAASGPVGTTSAATLGSVSTTAYVQNAARSDMYEVQAGRLAQQKAQDAKIKDFGRMMVTDHTKSTQMIKAALPSGVTAPTALDKRRQGLLDNLKASNGAEFDKRYVAQQIAAHQEALTLHQGYAQHGDNVGLKRVAAEIAPVVSRHLQMAKMLPGAK